VVLGTVVVSLNGGGCAPGQLHAGGSEGILMAIYRQSIDMAELAQTVSGWSFQGDIVKWRPVGTKFFASRRLIPLAVTIFALYHRIMVSLMILSPKN